MPSLIPRGRSRELLETVATWLEAGGHELSGTNVKKFYMPAFAVGSSCGTACCIAGAVVALTGRDPVKMDLSPHDKVESIAREALNLTSSTAEKLFFGGDYNLSAIDAAWAARTVRGLLATGKVDWSRYDERGLPP